MLRCWISPENLQIILAANYKHELCQLPCAKAGWLQGGDVGTTHFDLRGGYLGTHISTIRQAVHLRPVHLTE